ncbi:ABC transporter permease subunit [Pradoshia sp.]
MIIGVIMISGLPYLFRGIGFHIADYLESIKNVVLALLNPQSIDYGGAERAVFPQIFIPYENTMMMIAISFIGSILTAFLFTYIILLLGRRHAGKIQWVLSLLQALPDLFYIAFSQWMVVLIYRSTGILVMEVASDGTFKSLALPLICLSLPIVLLLTKFLLQQFLDESRKVYVEYASSKGFSELYIFNKHIFRNVFFSLINYSKTVMWFMVSNLIIIELLFSINGLVGFIFRYLTPEVFAVGVIMLVLPVMIFYEMAQLLIPHKRRG